MVESKEPARESHVRSEMGFLEKKVTVLEDIVKMLRERLSSVVNARPPEVRAEGKNEVEMRVPLAGDIRKQRFRIESVTEDLNDILQNIEL